MSLPPKLNLLTFNHNCFNLYIYLPKPLSHLSPSSTEVDHIVESMCSIPMNEWEEKQVEEEEQEEKRGDDATGGGEGNRGVDVSLFSKFIAKSMY